MMVAVAAMFIILSVFSGLEDLNKQMIDNLHADITIRPSVGKVLPDMKRLDEVLKKNPAIKAYSSVIEEKVYVKYGDKGEIGYMRAVDQNYILVNPIQKSVFYGNYPDFKVGDEVLLENSLDHRLAIPVGNDTDIFTLYMPKAGEGIINREEDLFNKINVVASGVFPGNEQLNNYIITPLQIGQQLLSLPQDAAYSIVVKLKAPSQTDAVRDDLEKLLGNKVKLTTKAEENAAFWKMINTEKLMIYLIFALVIFITTFNLAGAIIILQLDKLPQYFTLRALGMDRSSLKKVYFYTGGLIVQSGVVTGLVIGSITCWIQMKFGIAMATKEMPFPVKIEWANYILVAALGIGLGTAVSWVFSHYYSPSKNIRNI